MVRVPILIVKIGPNSFRSSATYWKNGLPERATWKRFPTIGHPGGPGGRLTDLDLDFLERKKINAEMRKAKRVKKEAAMGEVGLN